MFDTKPDVRRFATGLVFLDRRIDGGLPVGSLVAVLAPPASQSQRLLRAVTGERPLVYLSTSVRDASELES